MANQPLTMAKVRQILKLLSQGCSKLQISERTGCSRNTIKKYLRIYHDLQMRPEDIDNMNNYQLSELFCVDDREPNEKVKTLLAMLPQIEKSLKRKGMTRTEQWKQYLNVHPDGLKFTRFCCILNRYLNHTRPVMHIEHKAGDKMFVDFAGEKMHYWNRETGEKIEVEIFAAILGCSQLVYAQAVASQKKEDLIRCCENALHYYGGTPCAIVPDNLRSAVTKSSRYEPTINEAFEDFATHYGMSVLPARAYRPRDKAHVENIVKILYSKIYIKLDERTFYSLDELNEAIRPELEVLNSNLLTGRTYSRREQFDEIESGVLKPLPQYKYQFKQQYICTVMKNGHVRLSADKHYYSVPYQLIGKKVKLLYSDTSVEVYYDYDCVATHGRNVREHQYTTIKEHLASTHRFVSEWSAGKFIEAARLIHEDVATYITQVIENRPHPEAAYKSCLGILNLARKVGNERLINACRRALHFGVYGYYQIDAILQKKLDQLQPEEHPEGIIKMHQNIRGSNYYK